MNRKAKGSRNERRSKSLLEGQGFQVIKSGGSLGVFDLIGVAADKFILVQVKTNRWPSLDEMKAIQAFPCPESCQKAIHRWMDRQQFPDVKKIGEEK